ncbi:hypothetical protein QA597_00855 [Marinilabiliaceae bacterium ANBcel2]|nr:hypothetical protein [Marinilabiliaceae bacterium ANBcel2]
MKIILFFFLILGLSLHSCDDSVKEFGDKSLASELKIVSITDSVGEYNYNFTNPDPVDTTYIYYYLERDTIFKPDGTVDDIAIDTVYYEGKTAKLYKVDLILLPSYKNRLYIEIASNARWEAPPIPFASIPATWIKNDRISGVGDAIIDYDVSPRHPNPDIEVDVRRRVVTQYITTRDSTIMYELNFQQKATTED